MSDNQELAGIEDSVSSFLITPPVAEYDAHPCLYIPRIENLEGEVNDEESLEPLLGVGANGMSLHVQVAGPSWQTLLLFRCLYFLGGISGSTWGRFSTVYYNSKGLSSGQIGLIEGVMPIAIGLMQPLWGIAADFFNSKKKIFFITRIVNTSLLMLLSVPVISDGFTHLFLLSLGMSLFVAPGFVDAYVLETLGERSKELYGRLRMWTAVSWGLGSFVMGIISDKYGFNANFILYLGFTALSLVIVGVFVHDDQPRKGSKGLDGKVEGKNIQEGDKGDWDVQDGRDKGDCVQEGKIERGENGEVLDMSEDGDKADAGKEEGGEVKGWNGDSARAQNGDARGVYFEHGVGESGTGKVVECRCKEAKEEEGVLSFVKLWDRLMSWECVSFFLEVLFFGMAMGVIERGLLFLYVLQDLKGTPTLCGAIVGVTVIFELPVFHYSGWILEKMGHGCALLASFASYVVRVYGYTLLTHETVHYIYLLEMMHGITFALMWVAVVERSRLLTPRGWTTTFQSMLGGVYSMLGQGIGAAMGGYVMERYGAIVLFRGCCALVAFMFFARAGVMLTEKLCRVSFSISQKSARIQTRPID